MTGFLDRIKERRRQKALIQSILNNKPEDIHEKYTPEEIAALRVTEETYQQYDKGEERTVLTLSSKTAFALALDNMSDRIIDYLAPIYRSDPPVAFFETHTVRGLISQDKIRQTKFKSVQKTVSTMSQYLNRWNQGNNHLLFIKDGGKQADREAYEKILKAMREEYGITGSEFSRTKH